MFYYLQGEELTIELEGKKLTQEDSFVYLGGAVWGDGKTEKEVRRRAQARANAWIAVEGVMADRRISKRMKGKVMSTCVKPACLYGTETLAMTERQQQQRHKLGTKNSKSNEGRQEKNGGLKGRDVSAEEIDRETVEEQTKMGKTVERMADDRLPRGAAELRERGRRIRGRPRLRWEDCVKRDVRKAGEEEDWKKKTRYRGWWKRL